MARVRGGMEKEMMWYPKIGKPVCRGYNGRTIDGSEIP